MAAVVECNRRLGLFIWILNAVLCSGQFAGWEDYISSWQGQTWSTRMYPFGESYFDNRVRNTDGQDAEINFILPFYGNIYSAAYISMLGHIELSSTNPATSTPKSPNTWWPNEDYPQTGDVPFISPYYAHFEMTNLPTDTGRLYWRRVDPREETDPAKSNIATKMVDLLSEEVKTYVLGSEQFEGRYALIATWNDSTFYACENVDCPTNTLQVALVTDEQSTYVIYNYYSLTWIGSFRQGYDMETGRSCQSDCVPAQVGFNAGGARAFHALPFSGTDDVLRLAETSGTGITGRFIYKVDSMNIIRGGCSNVSDIDPVDWPLVLSPTHGTMLGGQLVYVSGPCLMPYMSVRCMFGEVVVEGLRLSNDYTKAACPTPFVGYTGRTMVRLSTNNGKSWPYTGWFTYDPLDEGPELVMLDNPDLWSNKSAQSLSLRWEPSALEDIYETVTNNTPAFNVDILLSAYFETLTPNGSLGEIKQIHVLAENIQNSGMFAFNVAEHQCPDQSDCQWGTPLPSALIEIRRADTDSRPRTIWSGPFPLGWYGNDAWTRWHGDDWAEQFCGWWFDYESANMTWLDNLEPCPATERQALADCGRFSWNPCNSTTPGICDSDDQMACYEQLTPNAKQWPAVSHCCYNKEGHLVYASDENKHGMGSSSYKATRRGDRKTTYGKIPVLSHYTWDSVFRTLCCNWTSDPKYCQDMYLRVRPTKDTQEYRTPRSITSFGDPHFRTFDGVDYTFNGRGEYWLLQVYDMEFVLDNIVMQVRLEKPSEEDWGDVRATIITSVVMQEGYADDMTVPIIEITMAESEASVRQKLLISGATYDLRPDHSRELEITYRDNTRLILITNNERTPYPDNKQSNITVVFESGIMVQVAYVDGALHVISSLPPKYKGKTAGLFGLWNEKKDDDLTTPSGEPIDYTRGNEFIHYYFGEKWILSDAESRFTYRGSLKSSDYHHPEFVPYFTEPVLPPNSTLSETDVDEACGVDFVCRFDYKTTLSRSLAVTSSAIKLWTSEMVQMSESVPVCPYIDVPYSRREVTSYTSGGTLLFTGCADGYTLQGHLEYTCVAQNGSAYWQPEPDILCKANSEIAAEKQQKAIMIAVPICCAVVVAGLATGGYFLYRDKKSINRGRNSSGTHPFSNSPGLGEAGPPTVSGQFLNPELLSRWMERSAGLVGSADLGALQIHGHRGLSEGTRQDRGISLSPDPEYARVIRHGTATNSGAALSSELRPTMTQQSSSIDSFDDDPTEDQENDCNEILAQNNGNRSGSELNVSRLLMHQSQLSASQFQLHASAVEDQPTVPEGGRQDHLASGSVSDLIQLDGSFTDNVAQNATNRCNDETNQPRLRLASERFSQSYEGLQQSGAWLASGQGYTNLAASMGSLKQRNENPTMLASRQASRTSLHCAGGIDNVALATDEAKQETPASRFAVYEAASGSDTVV